MDIDDNPPQFAVHSADVEILENLNNGAIIYTPSVTDIDKVSVFTGTIHLCF